MKFTLNRIMQAAVIAALSSTVLTACNSSSDEGNTAVFSMGVSDAPVDQAARVLVCFESVQLVGNGQPPQRFDVGGDNGAVEANDLCLDSSGNPIPNTKGVDLLTLQGAAAEDLVVGAEVEAGTYGQLRLDIADGSEIELMDGTIHDLRVPSGQLRLDGPTLMANQTFNYTLEFDLRRAVVAPPGLPHYLLTPRGLRLVDNAEVGHIEGQVAETLLIDNECAVAPEDLETPVAAVYLYSGHDVAFEDMADNSDDDNGPYASATVFYDGAANYEFAIGYIQSGNYTVAVTCDTDDDPEEETELNFFHSENIQIEAGVTLDIIVGDNG
ncbi:DUF4382 domain-containing protein [Aliidiomarina halalkaliphila]|uniref:DUF4382 domain-containing protein n=1 Tax=Aliidiomarina halalkaliphila TaxID=2593535 RepID=A0A552WYH7_9GAMM|nr:DUF4382 domain-containing protein [Aliidiomarina halalkaliphila]TRW47837.1 DUF4382 domain-containing protein [Aliidiomarina halalkaliphila]